MFEWLNDYKVLKRQLIYKQDKLDAAKSELWRWTHGDLQEVKLSKDSIASGLEQHIMNLHAEVSVLITRLDNLNKMISKFDDLDSTILRMKYIDGVSLYEIAEQTAYSYGHIRNRHSVLMKSIKLFDEVLLKDLEVME